MTATAPSELVFGKYEVLRRLAVGGMGEIFLARETNEVGIDRLVILKNLLPELAQNRSFVDAFLDEARVASTMSHPNIVSMYEVGSWKGVYYICMEYIEGDSLMGLLQRVPSGGFPPRVAARIIRDAAMGLSYAHEATRLDGAPLEIVHRDISPHNIMVRLDGVTKVVDFGIALARSRHSRTATGLIKGKLRYLAPEQLTQTSKLDGRADQYALGAVFWELLTGQPLVDAPNDAMLIQVLLAQKPLPPSALVPSLPVEYDAIVMKMLATEREGRFASCRDVGTEIDQQIFASLQLATSEEAVAKFVERLLGDELSARRRDLTPSRDFVMPARSLSQSEPSATFELPANALVGLAAVEKSERVARLLRVGAIALALLALAAGMFLVRSDGPSGEPAALPLAAPAPLPIAMPSAIAVITSSPLGAVVYEADINLGVTPLTLELTGAAPRILRVETPGYAAAELAISAEGGRTQTPHITLKAIDAPKTGSPLRAPQARPQSPKRHVERTGYLSVRTVPWTRVSIGPKTYGTTPVLNIELPVGVHMMTLVNEERGVSVERSIDIRPGETTKMDLRLK